jgi:hypothetical protein
MQRVAAYSSSANVLTGATHDLTIRARDPRRHAPTRVRLVAFDGVFLERSTHCRPSCARFAVFAELT